MKYGNWTFRGLTISLTFISIIACNTSNKEPRNTMDESHDHSEMKSDTITETEISEIKSDFLVLDHYLMVKDALVSDNQENASVAGIKLSEAFQDWKLDSLYQERQEELMALVVKIEEHGEQIGLSEIDQQRSIFAELSKDMVDLIAITGTPRTLYQQYCPMYNKNTGGLWLSDSKEIRNPLFGSQMLTCGAIQAELK